MASIGRESVPLDLQSDTGGRHVGSHGRVLLHQLYLERFDEGEVVEETAGNASGHMLQQGRGYVHLFLYGLMDVGIADSAFEAVGEEGFVEADSGFKGDGELGTHEALYAGNAEYRKMVDLQKLEEEGGANND